MTIPYDSVQVTAKEIQAKVSAYRKEFDGTEAACICFRRPVVSEAGAQTRVSLKTVDFLNLLSLL